MNFKTETINDVNNAQLVNNSIVSYVRCHGEYIEYENFLKHIDFEYDNSMKTGYPKIDPYIVIVFGNGDFLKRKIDTNEERWEYISIPPHPNKVIINKTLEIEEEDIRYKEMDIDDDY